MSPEPPLLELRGVSVHLGREPVIYDLDLSVAPRELVALLGPNGSGKTTLLRAIVGLERASAGHIFLDGQEITRVPTHRRRIGLLMQEPALFARRTVLENVAYGPLVQGRTLEAAREEAARALEAVRLSGFETRPAGRLSGGERQRVALARAIAARPRVILLDEPFAAIDPEVRGELRGDFRRVLSELGIAAVHVTHDREEGLFLGDRVAVLVGGRIRTSGPPREVLRDPGSAEVARFLGYNVVQTEEGLCAFFPREAEILPPTHGTTEGQLLASGFTGRDYSAIARTRRGERVEVVSEAAPHWPPAGAVVGLRWSHSVPVSEP